MTSTFKVVLRGYDRGQVDRLLSRADAAVASGDEALRTSVRNLLGSPDLTMVLRGYARDEVDHAVNERLQRLGPTASRSALYIPAPSTFLVALRGSDMMEVNNALARFDAAMQSDSELARAAARDALRAAGFTVRIRGYARAEVDRAVRERLQGRT